MKIIKPSVELWKHDIHPYEFMEKVGRVCYKSEDRITEGSAEKMIKALKNSKHYAILEHEHLYFELSNRFMTNLLVDMALNNERLTYFNITNDPMNKIHILSGSFRSFIELFERNKEYNNPHLKLIESELKLKYPLVFGEFNRVDTIGLSQIFNDIDCVLLSREDFEFIYHDWSEVLFKHLIHTFNFITNRGVTHEFVRHRPASYAQESTRYCNYSNDKFNNEITVIEPLYYEVGSPLYEEWKSGCEHDEKTYFNLLELGAKPQEARGNLPTDVKTELVITATEEELQHIVDLRWLGVTGAPHPQAKEIMGLSIDDIIKETNNRVKLGA